MVPTLSFTCEYFPITCSMYKYGTQSFLIHRTLVAELIKATPCFQPIDLHISANYLLRKTNQPLVGVQSSFVLCLSLKALCFCVLHAKLHQCQTVI
mgnify:CR=1 FL=1